MLDPLKIYTDHLHEYNYAQTTIKTRSEVLFQFAVSGLGPVEFILARPSPATQQKCKIILSHYYQILIAKGIEKTNPVNGMAKILQAHALPKFITQSAVTNIMDAIDVNTFVGVRDKAILELGLSIAARRGDYANMNLDDINIEQRTIRILGKGRKEAYLPLNNHAIKALSAYLLRREQFAKDQALFITEKGERVISYYTIFRKHIKGTTPHAFTRHSTAIACLQNGMDINVLQSFLRHESLQTTSHYLTVTQENLKSIHAKTHPRE